MNTAKMMPQGAVRPLTAKQQRFVLALLEGNGKSAAYRIAYGNNPDPHAVSAQAYRVANSPAVKAALSQAEMGNFAGLTICGTATQLLALKRIANDPSAPSYVRLSALQSLLEHEKATPEPDLANKPETKRPETVEDLMRVLQADCGQKPGVAHQQYGFDEANLDEIQDFDLDEDQ
jgi:hypothetical protein